MIYLAPILAMSATLLATPIRAQLGLLDFNLFSVEQEIELGKQGAAKVDEEKQLLRDPWMQDYMSRLGVKVASRLPSQDFPFTFKIIVTIP